MDEPPRQRLGTPGAPDQGAQWLLPILWPAALLRETWRSSTAGTEALAKDLEASKPAWPPNRRLGQPTCQTVVPTSRAAPDTGVGLSTFKLNDDLFWGARCVNRARRVLTGGRWGDLPSLPDPRPQTVGVGVSDGSEVTEVEELPF